MLPNLNPTSSSTHEIHTSSRSKNKSAGLDSIDWGNNQHTASVKEIVVVNDESIFKRGRYQTFMM